MRTRGFAVFIYLLLIFANFLMSLFAFFFPDSIIRASKYYLIRNYFSSLIVLQFAEFIVPLFVFCMWLFNPREEEDEELLTSEQEPLPAPHAPLPIFQCANEPAESDLSLHEPLLSTPKPLPAPLPCFTSEASAAPTADGSGVPVVIVSEGSDASSHDPANEAVSGGSSAAQSPLEPVVVVASEHPVVSVDEHRTIPVDEHRTIPVDEHRTIPVDEHRAIPVDSPTVVTLPSTNNHPTVTSIGDVTANNNQTLCCICKKNPATMRINPCEEEICSSCSPTGGRCPSCGALILTIESIRSCPVCLEHIPLLHP